VIADWPKQWEPNDEALRPHQHALPRSPVLRAEVLLDALVRGLRRTATDAAERSWVLEETKEAMKQNDNPLDEWAKTIHRTHGAVPEFAMVRAWGRTFELPEDGEELGKLLRDFTFEPKFVGVVFR
jgi:hypothetical protein